MAFFAASALATFLFGVAVGNSMLGHPDRPRRRVHRRTFLDLLRPYPLLVGLLAVATFAMHGSIYLYLKTEGELQQRIHGWMWRTFGFFLVLYMLVTTICTLATVPAATRNFTRTAVGVGRRRAQRARHRQHPARDLSRAGRSTRSSRPACTIAALVFLFGVALLPEPDRVEHATRRGA